MSGVDTQMRHCLEPCDEKLYPSYSQEKLWEEKNNEYNAVNIGDWTKNHGSPLAVL